MKIPAPPFATPYIFSSAAPGGQVRLHTPVSLDSITKRHLRAAANQHKGGGSFRGWKQLFH